MSYIRAFIPDSHGSFIDEPAAKACISDLKRLAPKQIVMLGDHVDASGIFSTHENNYIDDMDYSYAEDCAKANWFLDEIQKAAPRAEIHYLFGNHEAHVQRTIARTHRNSKDARWALALQSPAAALKLKSRGVRWYEPNEFYHGLSIRGTIKLGRTYATHGITAAKHAASIHAQKFGVNTVSDIATERSRTLLVASPATSLVRGVPALSQSFSRCTYILASVSGRTAGIFRSLSETSDSLMSTSRSFGGCLL